MNSAPLPAKTADRPRLTARQRRRERAYFLKVRRAELTYAIQLRKVAKHVGEIIQSFRAGDPRGVNLLLASLDDYSRSLEPWAQATATRMLSEVMRRDETAWRQLGNEIGQSLAAEIRGAPIGNQLRRLLNNQVALITSIPLDAGRRVHELTQSALSGGRRYDDIVPMILASGDVARSRAVLIARTETSRTASQLMQARAVHIGSEGYVWRTALDADVRPVHRKLEGKFCQWDDPPLAGENGEHAHPGEIFNCRCWAEPILPGTIE